jgi:WD40 repeat protein
MALDSNLLVSGCSDMSVRVWSLITGSQVNEFKGHTAEVKAVAIRGDIVASGSEDETVRLWNIKTNEELGVLRGHYKEIRSVALTSTADTVVSSAYDSTVKVWSVSSLKLLFTWTRSLAYQIVLAKDNRYIFGGDDNSCCVRVWEYGKETEVCSLENLNQAEEWILNYPEIRMLAERFIW